MTPAASHDDRIATLIFAKVYPLYMQKVTRKGRTKAELDQVIQWLTGLDEPALDALTRDNATFATLFDAARLNPNATLIAGVICGVRVEDIATPLTRNIRYLDKIVDELAKGRPLDRIMRRP